MLRIKITCIFIIIVLMLIHPVTGETINITVSEDSYYYTKAGETNYGNEPYINTLFPDKMGFLKFEVPEYTEKAYLHIYKTDGQISSVGVSQASIEWNENTLTYNNKPGYINTTYSYDLVTNPANKEWITFNVSSAIYSPGIYSFCIRNGVWGHGSTWVSKEGAKGYAPYLEIHTTEYTDITLNNKTNNDSKCFLVNTSDCIKFTLNASDISSCEWYVNKTVQEDTDNTYNFTVPVFDTNFPPSGIWEIKVNGTFINNTTITREWLVSGLTEEQAPDFIEYFTSLDNRFHPFRDPWGRSFPTFYYPTINVASGGHISRTSSHTNALNSRLNITNGTYRFKVRNPPGGPDAAIEFNIIDTDGDTWKARWNLGEYHDYFAINSAKTSISGRAYFPISARWIGGQAPSQHYLRDRGWYTITMIKTEDGWFSIWKNDSQMVNNYGHYPTSILSEARSLELIADDATQMDCIEIYKDRYIYPSTEIRYGQYPKWWYLSIASSGVMDASLDDGIIVFGRELTLKQISDTLNNESLMTYNDTTKTAIIKTNLFLKHGTLLNITNETLLFDTSSESLFINPQQAVNLRIINSTISTTANNPLIWNVASAVSITVTDPDVTMTLPLTSGNDRCTSSYNFVGHFVVENSTINNSCNLLLSGAKELILNDTIFSNHSTADYGCYEYGAVGSRHNTRINNVKGSKAVWVAPRLETAKYSIKNVSFVDPKDNIIFRVTGGQWIFNDTILKDSDLSNIGISTNMVQKDLYFHWYTQPYENSSVGLLNCKVNESLLKVDTTRSKIKTKYYADIVVKDSNGNPIPYAVITPTSSNATYGAENLHEYECGDAINACEGGINGGTTDASIGAIIRWKNAQPLSYATTNTEGRTSLPYEDVNNSIVLIDYVLTNETGKQSKESIEYEFVVNASNVKPINLQGINPDLTWYREDPLKSTYTITAIIPNTSTKGPHITGFAPAEDNPFNSGEKKNFRVWTDEPFTIMEWRVNGSSVLKGSLNYTWTVTDRNTTIEFIGSNANGTVSQVWKLGASSDDPTQEIKFSPADSTLTKNISERVEFGVSPDVFTTKAWYINGCLIQRNTTSISKFWSAAGTYNVTFSGSGIGESVLHTWTVNVIEEQKNQNESIIKIDPEYQVVEPKKPFNLSIKIEPETSITGTQLDFSFNSSMTSVVNVTEGDLLKQSGAYTIFSSGNINNSAGAVKNIYGFILGTSNVSLPGTMATVNLTAGNKTGMAKFGLSNVIISDANSKSVPYTVTNATVLIDTAPVIAPIEPKSVEEKSTLAFKVSAKDADGDRLVLTASGVPQGAVFNTTSGNFTWTPAVGQAGVYTITFKVSDGYLTDSQSVTVTVNKLNNLPVISSFEPLNGSSFSEGERIGVSVNASDADGQALNYSIRIDGVECSTGKEYVWETDYSSSGNHTIEVVVSDGIDEVKQQHIVYISECHPRWDVDENGIVNILDVTSVSQKYGTTVSKPYPRYDINQDGFVNILDLTLVGNHFGEYVK